MDRPREQVKKEFEEDLQILSAFLDAADAQPSESGSLGLAAIPDLSDQFGFGAPVVYGSYSHSHTPDATEREDDRSRHQRVQELLRRLADSGAEVPVAAALRAALDAVDSESSLQEEAQRSLFRELIRLMVRCSSKTSNIWRTY